MLPAGISSDAFAPFRICSRIGTSGLSKETLLTRKRVKSEL
jgi:hypothetical protein